MLPVALLDVKTLSAEQRASFFLLTPPRYRDCLFGRDPYQISYAKIIAARLGALDKPVGLVLSSHYEGLGVGTIVSIHVEPPFQGKGEVKALMDLIEAAHVKEKATLLDFFFKESDSQQGFFRRLLSECAWAPPQIYLKQYFFDVFSFHPSWFLSVGSLSADFEIFGWDALAETERLFIEKQYRHNRFNAHVYPFTKEELYEKELSFGLRCRGEVVGWSLVQKVSPDTIKYSILYVDAAFQHSGGSAALLAASIRQQQKSACKWALFEYAVDFVPLSWVHFVEKRLKPYAIDADVVYRSWKFL